MSLKSSGKVVELHGRYGSFIMHPDFLVVGAGVIGISIALELKRRFRDVKITVIEKEEACALHASGRNSGVLHAGFYYTADSLKAKFTRDGNKLLTNYCDQNNIPVNKCGKLVVAKDENENILIDELLSRGRKNGVNLEELSVKEAQAIEPRIRTFERAIFSPTTSSVDPVKVVHSFENDAINEGVNFIYNAKYVKRKKKSVVTTKGEFEADYVINSAGLYADYIAKDFGFSEAYSILPFKGLYLYSDEPVGSIRTNIYPVPDLKNPFLGVHFTVTVDGRVKIGPTAIPAFWREQYEGASNFQAKEFVDIVRREIGLFASSNFGFMKLAVEEIRKYSRKRMVSLASTMVTGTNVCAFKRWAKPGIRAQLVNTKERRMEMDFVLEGDDKSMHVLNAVSPGFTCCIPFSKYICDEIEKKLN